jgi:hypothetical protein
LPAGRRAKSLAAFKITYSIVFFDYIILSFFWEASKRKKAGIKENTGFEASVFEREAGLGGITIMKIEKLAGASYMKL